MLLILSSRLETAPQTNEMDALWFQDTGSAYSMLTKKLPSCIPLSLLRALRLLLVDLCT